MRLCRAGGTSRQNSMSAVCSRPNCIYTYNEPSVARILCRGWIINSAQTVKFVWTWALRKSAHKGGKSTLLSLVSRQFALCTRLCIDNERGFCYCHLSHLAKRKKISFSLKIVRIYIYTHTADLKGISVIFLLLLLAMILKIIFFNILVERSGGEKRKKLKSLRLYAFSDVLYCKNLK